MTHALDPPQDPAANLPSPRPPWDPRGNRERALERAARQQELEGIADVAGPARQALDDDVIDLRQYWHILLRRKRTVLLTLLIAFLVSVVATFNTTPIFRAELLLQIDPQEQQFLEYQDDISTDSKSNTAAYYQTQYELLKSRSLARRVIDQLGLVTMNLQSDTKPSFFAELGTTIGSWFGAPAPRTTENRGGEDDKANLERALIAKLAVLPVKNSRLVDIHYESADPRRAAAVANAIAANFIDMSLERRYESTSYAKKFLKERIEQVRANLEDSEQRLVAYAREREFVDLDNKLGNLMQTLDAMNQALVEAEAERIQTESEYTQALGGTGSATRLILENGVIQTLKRHKSDLETQYQEQLGIYKPGYPKMQQLRGQIDELDAQIQHEIAAIQHAIKSDLDAKIQQQASLQTRVGEIKSEILALQDRSIDYQSLKREVDTNRQLYDGLLQRMKEVGVIAGITTNNISIVDRAQVPQTAYKPNLPKNLALALAMGLIGGVLLAFLFEHLDDTIKSTEDVEGRLHAPVLGIVPFVDPREYGRDTGDVALLTATDPKSPLAEAVRSLRTSLMYSTAEGAPRIMHFTSSESSEGKTTAASNIAIAFALAGSKVLLIDADLRAPSLHRVFDLSNAFGLTNYLIGDSNPADIALPTDVTGLFAITSGPVPPNPVELLASTKMLDLLGLAHERFDHVVLDGPPIIGLADAVVLANLAANTIFVVDAEHTRHGALTSAVKRLDSANATIVGAVINRFGRTGKGYGYSYDYHHYSYDYGARIQTPALEEQA